MTQKVRKLVQSLYRKLIKSSYLASVWEVRHSLVPYIIVKNHTYS